MKKMTLDDMMDLAMYHARMILIEYKQPDLKPAFSILQKEGAVDIMVTPWNSDREKQAALDHVRKFLKDEGSLAYCIVGEAWSTVYTSAEMREGVVMPSKSDRRVEVVIAVAASLEGEKKVKSYELVRGDDGYVVDFKATDRTPVFTDMAGLFD